jgi:adenylate cyclase
LKNSPIVPELVPPLLEFLREGDDSEVAGLRPKLLARLWGAPLRDVLRLCLHATKIGLLNLSWHQMCPHCRVSKSEYSSLSQMTNQFDCDVCGVTYEANFDRYVELRFGVHPKVRAASADIYCIGSPLVTPHILAQTILEANGTATLHKPLVREKLRLRVLKLNHILPIGDSFSASGPALYEDDGWMLETVVPAPDGAIEIVNRSERDLVLALEKEEWDDNAVTAAEVTALREFRDLFSSEVLAPGQSVGIESLTLLFTDLCDSTALYELIGDAPAYGRVRKHFAWLFDIIGAHSGAIVKTIGDSVMAVFQSPEDALCAAIEIQKQVLDFNALLSDANHIALKIGLHHGPAIAINSNDRLDYFGRTVNIAARLLGASRAMEIVFSGDVAARDGIQKILLNESLAPESFLANLKGIKGVFELQRVTIEAERA